MQSVSQKRLAVFAFVTLSSDNGGKCQTWIYEKKLRFFAKGILKEKCGYYGDGKWGNRVDLALWWEKGVIGQIARYGFMRKNYANYRNYAFL